MRQQWGSNGGIMENRFPAIWVPDAEKRDLRQLLWHPHRLVQMRTRIMNQLYVVALRLGWKEGPINETEMALSSECLP
jgi:hypothetical protein